jgi:hypothetical protein
MEQEELTTQADPDWDSRILCSDGRCTGIIGPDGRCGECGAAYEGGPSDEISHAEPDNAPSACETACAAEEALPQDSEPDPDWDSRVLCSDGNCIGVIGPDGRCKECGLPLKEG